MTRIYVNEIHTKKGLLTLLKTKEFERIYVMDAYAEKHIHCITSNSIALRFKSNRKGMIKYENSLWQKEQAQLCKKITDIISEEFSNILAQNIKKLCTICLKNQCKVFLQFCK